jgi:UDP-glucose 4-epimerase
LNPEKLKQGPLAPGAQGITSLVTGGAGFIGSHVVDSLLEMGHRVLVVDDLSGGFRENVNPSATLIEGSVTDVGLVDELFARHSINYVYHIAAYAAEGLSHFIRNFNYTNNLLGSMNLINNAVRHRCRCFVFTSSIAVYGSGRTPMHESMVPQPEDPYGISKYAVELDLLAAKHMFGLDSIIFRPHNVYGERQNIGDPYRNVIGIFMNQILQGLPCPIFGDGTQTRAFTHIADVAPIIAQSVDYPSAYNQIFNVGADIPYSVNELAREVQAAMGKDTGTVHLPARNEVVEAFSDHSKARETFGTSADITLAEGLQRMADWVRKVGARRGKPFDNVEIERELPPSWKELCTTPRP